MSESPPPASSAERVEGEDMESRDHAPSITAVTSGYTPGPWRLAPATCYIGDGPAPSGLTGISADGWGDFALVVTRMADEPFDHPQGVANARLIAAAPDLLADLAALNKAIDDFWNAEPRNREPQIRALCEAQQKSFATIAKATGAA